MDFSKEKLKRYFWALFGAVAIIAFWAGVWDGVGYLPYLENPWLSLAIGLVILVSSGYLFKEFDPLEDAEIKITNLIRGIHKDPKKHEYHIKLHDKVKRKDILFEAKHLKDIEKGFLVFMVKEGKEIFVPIHRVKEIMHKGKSFWKH